ncbi:energy transducer TonB [Sphingopyxis kveilinensis]|uniref:energy transducer TonB n=1 Tax=Sphingopyxis kveilinensis TaxID=3114367 RepID=UPI0030CCC119
MAYSGQVSRPQKLLSGGGALAAALAIGVGLASGLDLDVVRRAGETITAIALPAPPAARENAFPAPAPSERTAGKASAANKQAKAAPIAAPAQKLPPLTPPAAAAPQPGAGSDSSAGATPDPGPGSGAGGRGDGTGAGGTGTGTGGGTKAVWRSGTIHDRDYPRDASRERVGGEVEVRFTIEADGRVTGCRVTRSSGNAALDRRTCELIEARFRFKPATNAAGEAIASPYGWRQRWWLEPRR